MVLNDKTYIGYSKDSEIRYKASSGGIVTSIFYYLFTTKQIQSALCCNFDIKTCRYELKFIYDLKEYKITGSIYQDLDVVSYVKDNINKIKGCVLIVCAPCQVRPLKSILNRNNIKNIIIDYFCSGQTKIEGTYCFYRFLGIKKKDVLCIKYRGDGWPNGIKVELKNGKIIQKENYTEPWKTINASKLYAPYRCIMCKQMISNYSDISVGDPWLKEYINNDRLGNTIFVVHTPIMEKIIDEMISCKRIEVKNVDYGLYIESQHSNIVFKATKNPKLQKIEAKILSNNIYRTIFASNIIMMKIHIYIIRIIKKIYKKINLNS